MRAEDFWETIVRDDEEYGVWSGVGSGLVLGEDASEWAGGTGEMGVRVQTQSCETSLSTAKRARFLAGTGFLSVSEL